MPRTSEEEGDGAERGAASEPDAGCRQRDAGGEHHEHRPEDHAELRHAEVELGLERRMRPMQEGRPAARRGGATGPTAARRGAAASRRRAPASTIRIASPIRVIAAPPISIRCVGPQSVTSWPKMRCQTSSSGKPISANAPQQRDQHAAERRVPVAAMRTALGDGLSRGSTHARKPAVKIAEQAAEDEVVRGVGERAFVAAVVDVERDVPEQAEERDQRDAECDRRRERRPAGQAADALGVVREAPEVGDLAGAVA